MAKVTINRSGRNIAVKEKLAHALVKAGRFSYARRDMAPEPVEVIDPPAQPEVAAPAAEPVAVPKQQAAAPETAQQSKRTYKRRDMKAG